MTNSAEYIDEFKKLIPSAEVSMPRERMVQLGMEHELCEFSADMEGLIATLVDVPVYELHPRGVRITGRDAVRAFYSKTIPIFQQFDEREKEVKTRKVLSLAFGESHVACEVESDFTFPNGISKRVQFLAVVEYRDDAIYGERVYSDAEFAKVMAMRWERSFLLAPM